MSRLGSLLAVLVAVLATAAPVRAQQGGPERDGALVIVLDPGHGGPHPHEGAHGRGTLVEKTIALQVAQRLKSLLEEAGATVLLTREDDDADVPLAARAQLANESAADLLLSIHCNSMATSAQRALTRGIETYFLSPDPTDAEAKLLAELENGGPEAVPIPKTNDAVTGLLADLALGQARTDSAALAQIVQRYLIRATGAQSRGVRQAPLLVLAGAKMPAALVEIGFISHPQEGKALAKEKYQQRIAEALAAAVRDFADQVLSRRLTPGAPGEPRLARGGGARAPLASSAARTAKPAARGPAATAPAQAASLPPSAPALEPAAPAPSAAAPEAQGAVASSTAPETAAPPSVSLAAAAAVAAPAPAEPTQARSAPASPAAPAPAAAPEPAASGASAPAPVADVPTTR